MTQGRFHLFVTHPDGMDLIVGSAECYVGDEMVQVQVRWQLSLALVVGYDPERGFMKQVRFREPV